MRPEVSGRRRRGGRRGTGAAGLAAAGLLGWRALAAAAGDAGTPAQARRGLEAREAIMSRQAAMAQGGARWRARELYRYLQAAEGSELRQPAGDGARTLTAAARALERDRSEARTLEAELALSRADPVHLPPDGTSPSASAAPAPPPPLAAPIAGARVVTPFGPGREPSTGISLVRSGVRLRGRPGQPVGAVAAGVVRRIEPSPAGGLALVVDHGGGWASILAGLPPASLPPALAPGARVARGDRVGQLAPAGGGAAEIVLELWRGRTPVDPVRHLPGR